MKIKGPTHESTTALFFLEGGPGSPAIKSNRFDLYKKLSEFGDVIILDQRGTGMSEEDLACPLVKNYPRDRPITAELAMELHLSMANECKDYLAKKGIDINSYNTLESAHDINDLREALGYDKITLVGMSYGSHLGLAVIRFYQKYIDKAILAGVEGYDHTYKMPSTFDQHLTLISNLVSIDSLASKEFPNFESFVRNKLMELEKEPVEVSINIEGTKKNITITSFLFKQYLAGMIGRREFITTILSDFRLIRTGNYSDFARYINQGYYERGIKINPVGVCMDCASGASDNRRIKIELEAKTSLFYDVVNFPFPEICDALSVKKLSENFRDQLNSNVPVLFISGSLDGRTPYENVKEIATGFPNSSYISVDGMGHNTNGLFLEVSDVMKTIEEFLNDKFNGKITYFADPIQFE